MRAALLVALAACAESHVTLRAPAPNITPAERVAMFHALERTGQDTATRSVNGGPAELVGARVVLADGTHVELPEDLLPVVAPDSDTARTARASANAGHRANTWLYIGIGALVATAVTIVAVETGSVDVGVPDDYLFGGGALVTLIPFWAAKHERDEEMQLRMQAFSTYTRDLGLRLDVCAHGLEVVACETTQPVQPPGLAPPQPQPQPPQPPPQQQQQPQPPPQPQPQQQQQQQPQ